MNRLYALDWNTNGTNDLVVTDEDGQVIDCLTEALFGVNVSKGQVGDGLFVTDGETTWYAKGDAAEGLTVVREVTPSEASRNAAVSPTTDGSALEAFLVRHLALNPWTIHGKALNAIHAAISERLTWKQHRRWQQSAPDTFRRRFADVARVTTNKVTLGIAAEGLKLVARCEALEAPRKAKELQEMEDRATFNWCNGNV